MGNAQGQVDALAAKVSKQINKRLKEDNERDRDTIKLLLLGTGESGKSTLLKQMKSLYGKPLNSNPLEARMQRYAVFSTIFQSFGALLEASDRFVPLANEDLKEAKEAIVKQANGMHSSFQETKLVNDKIREMLVSLWNDEGIRETWEKHQSDIQAQNSLEYFMDHAERVLRPEFEVKEEDWLRARLRTTGILSEEFTISKVKFNVYDVGGQRNERRKWIQVFSNVTSVIFVSAINEYDEVLFEDTNVNRLVESLNLFEEMVNHEEFVDAGMILFLNKIDLFREKIMRIPIKHEDANPMKSRWTDYIGADCVPGMEIDSPEFEQCFEDALDYFTVRFVNLNQHPSTKDIYVHITCATDKSNVDAVFGACKDIILKHVLKDQGFVRDF